MTTPETTIESSGQQAPERFGLPPVQSDPDPDPELELGPTNDPRRPSLYRNPAPKPSQGESVHDLVVEYFYDLDGKLLRKLPVDRKKLFRWVSRDLEDRRDVGQARYGTLLQVDNGRDSLIDGIQEVLDAVNYFYIAWQQAPSDRALRDLFESQLVLLLTARRILAVRNGELEPDGDTATPAASD